MFVDALNSITQLIQQYPTWAGVIVFLVAMIESLAIIGFIVPGVAIMFAIGALISNGTLELLSTVIWAAAGASIGDGLSFVLGWHYKEKVYQLAWLKKHQDLLDNSHQFFEKYGVFSILIGRFVGPIRAIIPLIAGIFGMPIKQYIPINLIASALWSPAYLFPGLIFGTVVSMTPEEWLAYWPISAIVVVIILVIVRFKKNRRYTP
jgi:membrane protein DedA with SNARE-associated domain